MGDGYWGNDDNYDPQGGRRRKFRSRFQQDEDVFGEASAEDYADNGTPYDMPIGQHAGGLDYDRNYEQSYSQRHGREYGDASQQYDPASGLGGSERAQQFRDRIQRRRQGNVQDYVIDAQNTSSNTQPFGGRGLERLSCSSPILLLLLFTIGLFVCMIMAFWAYNSLTRHLGL